MRNWNVLEGHFILAKLSVWGKEFRRDCENKSTYFRRVFSSKTDICVCVFKMWNTWIYTTVERHSTQMNEVYLFQHKWTRYICFPYKFCFLRVSFLLFVRGVPRTFCLPWFVFVLFISRGSCAHWFLCFRLLPSIFIFWVFGKGGRCYRWESMYSFHLSDPLDCLQDVFCGYLYLPLDFTRIIDFL
jgi:hypothetical protein